MKVMRSVMREKELVEFSSNASQYIVSLHHIGTLITLDMQHEHLLTFAILFFYTAKSPLWG